MHNKINVWGCTEILPSKLSVFKLRNYSVNFQEESDALAVVPCLACGKSVSMSMFREHHQKCSAQRFVGRSIFKKNISQA